MESDIDEGGIVDIATDNSDMGQDCGQKYANQQGMNMDHYPVLTSSTPISEKDETGVLKQLPTLQSNDSGFSDGTFISTPPSTRETPCSSLVSCVSDVASSSPAPCEAQDSLSNCDVSPINRKRQSIRSRRYRHSDPGIQTLAMRIQFMESNDNCSKASQSNTTSGERSQADSELKNAIENITLSTETSLKRHLLFQDILDRSRSCSRSLSSASDELEASFQELSLEESSSESRTSPASLPSSSPTFMFPSTQSNSRPQSPLQHNLSYLNQDVGSETTVSICDKKSNIPSNETPLYAHEEERSNCVKVDYYYSSDNEPANKLDFAACLSLTPRSLVRDPFEKLSLSTLSSNNENTVSVCESSPSPTRLPKVLLDKSSTYLVSPSSSLALCAPPPSPTKSCLDECNLRLAVFEPKSPSCENPLLKSPTKRTSLDLLNITSTSPLKMRKKMLHKRKEVSSIRTIKRDLSQDFLMPSQSTSNDFERSPQYLNINLLGDLPLAESNTRFPSPVSSGCSNERPRVFLCDDNSSASEDQSSTSSHLEKVIKMFSPSEPSRLIGRRVGLANCDIIGELTMQNFLGCLENIFIYLTDSDLVSVVNVCQTWKASVYGDPSAYQRYKRLRHAHRKVKLQIGKENSPMKQRDDSEPQVTAAKGPLCTVQQQGPLHQCQHSQPEEQEVVLMYGDTRRICPTCYGAALFHPAENRATCQRGNCGYNFCTLCFSAFHHPKPCKPLFPATSKTDLAGTRKSKRNLKRL